MHRWNHIDYTFFLGQYDAIIASCWKPKTVLFTFHPLATVNSIGHYDLFFPMIPTSVRFLFRICLTLKECIVWKGSVLQSIPTVRPLSCLVHRCRNHASKSPKFQTLLWSVAACQGTDDVFLTVHCQIGERKTIVDTFLYTINFSKTQSCLI